MFEDWYEYTCSLNSDYYVLNIWPMTENTFIQILLVNILTHFDFSILSSLQKSYSADHFHFFQK